MSQTRSSNIVREIVDIDALAEGFAGLGYVMDRALATAVYLLVKLRKPLLIEGHAGVGKTELAKALASFLKNGIDQTPML